MKKLYVVFDEVAQSLAAPIVMVESNDAVASRRFFEMVTDERVPLAKYRSDVVLLAVGQIAEDSGGVHGFAEPVVVARGDKSQLELLKPEVREAANA